MASQLPEGPGVQPTQPSALFVAALFGGLAGWLVVVAAKALGLSQPGVPWSAPITVWVTAIAVGGLAYATHQRIQVQRRYIEAQRAVAYLVLGKASALAGALIAGGYAVFGMLFIARIDADLPRDRVIRSAVAVGAGIALAIAGLLLERACKVPGSDSEDNDSDAPGSR